LFNKDGKVCQRFKFKPEFKKDKDGINELMKEVDEIGEVYEEYLGSECIEGNIKVTFDAEKIIEKILEEDPSLYKIVREEVNWKRELIEKKEQEGSHKYINSIYYTKFFDNLKEKYDHTDAGYGFYDANNENKYIKTFENFKKL
jgi:hypothetical protein